MRIQRALLGVVAVFTLGSCSVIKGSGNQAAIGFIGPVWNTQLAPTSASKAPNIGGYALMGAAEAGKTRVQINLSRAQSGVELPWHLHRGTCGNDQGIVGDPAKYGLLATASDGSATGVATLEVTMPTEGEYMVNVHASALDMTVVACGNLTSQ
jgi:hypothetical protein